jgi:hypothetical protein
LFQLLTFGTGGDGRASHCKFMDRQTHQGIVDALIYVQHYAPHFPAEDQTDLEAEFDLLHREIDQRRSASKNELQRHWYNLALADLRKAKRAYDNGDADGGLAALKSVENFCDYALRRKQLRVFLHKGT